MGEDREREDERDREDEGDGELQRLRPDRLAEQRPRVEQEAPDADEGQEDHRAGEHEEWSVPGPHGRPPNR